MQEPKHHEIWPAGAGKFAQTYQYPERQRGRNRRFLHEFRDLLMRNTRDLELDWECREELVYQVYRTKDNQCACANFCHEMRRVENVQRLQNSKANEEIHRKNPRNIRAAHY